MIRVFQVDMQGDASGGLDVTLKVAVAALAPARVENSLDRRLTEPSPNSASDDELVWSGASAPRLTRPLPWSSVSESLAGAMAAVCSLFWSYYRTVLQGRTTHTSEPTRLPTQLRRAAQYQISALLRRPNERSPLSAETFRNLATQT